MTAGADVRAALRDALRQLLRDKSTEADVRRTMESDAGYDPELWERMAEMGLTGLIVDPAHGGSGLGPLELEHVMEEAGAALLCSPFFSSAVLAAAVLQASGDVGAQARLLPGIAAGTSIATVALTGPKGTWTPEGVSVTADGAGDAARLTGTASYVTYGQVADTLLVVARTGGGYGIFEAAPGSAGVSITPAKTIDLTIRLATIEFAGAPAAQIGAAGWDAVEEALEVARVALAGEQAGAGERIFNMTMDYIKNRYQFGRPIGGFQALKHMAADLLVEKESAISAARDAAAALADKRPDARAAVTMGAFACKDAYSRIAADAVQMHGGIAFTWEFPVHLYLRRARSTAQLLGNATAYRERYIQILEAEA